MLENISPVYRTAPHNVYLVQKVNTAKVKELRYKGMTDVEDDHGETPHPLHTQIFVPKDLHQNELWVLQNVLVYQKASWKACVIC